MRCTQNPTIMEEWRLGWHPERVPRAERCAPVLVVVAGAAGLECALTPARRGHRVTLKDAEEGIAVKWFLLAVGMFVGATAFFVMVSGPVLLGVADAAVRTFYALVNIDGRITDWASGQERTTVHRAETSATALSGRPRVVDGDTIDVGGARVRLHGVDAPESDQSCVAQGTRWPCGRRATRALAGRLGGRTVVCEERDRDRYGRIVAGVPAG